MIATFEGKLIVLPLYLASFFPLIWGVGSNPDHSNHLCINKIDYRIIILEYIEYIMKFSCKAYSSQQ